MVERKTLNLVVVGSSPTEGVLLLQKPGSYGVMVSTVDSESTDPGSNPGRTSIFRRSRTSWPSG